MSIKSYSYSVNNSIIKKFSNFDYNCKCMAVLIIINTRILYSGKFGRDLNWRSHVTTAKLKSAKFRLRICTCGDTIPHRQIKIRQYFVMSVWDQTAKFNSTANISGYTVYTYRLIIRKLCLAYNLILIGIECKQG